LAAVIELLLTMLAGDSPALATIARMPGEE
jgi:hypothetical protein